MGQQGAAFFGLKLDLRSRAQLCDDICAVIQSFDGQKIADPAPVGAVAFDPAAANEPDSGPAPDCFRQLSLNASKLPQAAENRDLYRALRRANCLSADGMGVVWTARFLGIPVPERVTGIDLMTDLLARFAGQGVSVFLLGAAPSVVTQLQATLPHRYPGLIIAGAHHGFEADDDALARKVRQSGADALFVALPSPRKEIFVDRLGPQTGCRFVMAVGGAFDVLAGRVRRAPLIWQRAGLEFLWRIICQPRYMIPRYARGLSGFSRIVGPAMITHLGWSIWRKVPVRWVLPVLMVGMGAMLIPWQVSGAQVDDPAATSRQMIASGAASAPTASNSASPVTAAYFTDPDSTGAWLSTRLDKIDDVPAVQVLIDDICRLLIGIEPSDDKSPDGADWAGVDQRLDVLLFVIDGLLTGSPAGGFLIETVLTGVLQFLFDHHPDPARLRRMIQQNSPNIALRLFGDGDEYLLDAGFKDGFGPFDDTGNTAPDIRTQQRQAPERLQTWIALDQGLITRDAIEDQTRWDTIIIEGDTDPLAPEDVSPR
ncbi:WecB/TagA/CpsF family glycosyltransferase [Thalassospira sp. MA62]|nr:WecB/TagA/CpsF family glycosyltransferase [Thalassospira sp. MA62]